MVIRFLCFIFNSEFPDKPLRQQQWEKTSWVRWSWTRRYNHWQTTDKSVFLRETVVSVCDISSRLLKMCRKCAGKWFPCNVLIFGGFLFPFTIIINKMETSWSGKAGFGLIVAWSNDSGGRTDLRWLTSCSLEAFEDRLSPLIPLKRLSHCDGMKKVNRYTFVQTVSDWSFLTEMLKIKNCLFCSTSPIRLPRHSQWESYLIIGKINSNKTCLN